MNDYFGFVYIWMDIKNRMFYIGSHVGTLEDGYVGSNIHLKRAYKKRPKDFKRRILYFCVEKNRKILQEKEEYWLNMIKIEELGKKYYNLKRVAYGGNVMENYTEEQKSKYKQKLKKSAKIGEKHHKARKVVCFGKIFNTIKDAIKEIGFNPQRRLVSRRYIDFYYFNEGPITDEEIKKELIRKEEVKQKMIKIRGEALSKMSEKDKKNKARKSAETRKKTCPDIGNKISESLKRRSGKKVSIDGIIYDKGRIAAEILKMNYGTVKVRLRSKSFPLWYYIDDKIKNPL